MVNPPRCLVADVDEPAPRLSAEDRHHVTRVLRLRPGAELQLVDGRGGLAHASLGPDGAVLIRGREERAAPSATPLRMAVAAPRPSRLDWLVEKACELDVAELLLLSTEHGEHEVGAARRSRLVRIAEQAMLQCRRLHRMQISGPLRLEPTLAGAAGGEIWLASPPPGEPGTPPRARRPLLVLIGPEGGFSGDEEAMILAAGARRVRLGDTVLRVETAALALAALARGSLP